jgi:mono/diheme cytochrome c family protein
MAAAIIKQEQVVAEIAHAPEDRAFIGPLAEEATEVLDNADQGIDTDDDGLSDSAEAALSSISADAFAHFQAIDPVVLDPETADAELVDEGLAELEAGVEADPVLQTFIDAIAVVLDEDEITEENPDTDGDGISDAAEAAITVQFTEASASTVPSTVRVITLDPTSPETVPDVPDATTASNMVGGLDSVAINIGVTVDNEARILPQQIHGLEYLQTSQQQELWVIDILGVAEAMDASEDEAQRAVALFNANCARCHTAGWSAGVPYTQEAGAGGFGPALWDGRPVVQFGEAPPPDSDETDLLVEFLVNGSFAETPYGINGFGTGRMPAFGAILDPADIELLARYLRSGNMDGLD